MFEVLSTTILNKKVVSSQQLHVPSGASFCFTLKIDDTHLSVTFSQELKHGESPYIFMEEMKEGENNLRYVLGNFNQKHGIFSQSIDFFASNGKKYSFQIAATTTVREIRSTTIWLYTVVFYEEDTRYGQPSS